MADSDHIGESPSNPELAPVLFRKMKLTPPAVDFLVSFLTTVPIQVFPFDLGLQKDCLGANL